MRVPKQVDQYSEISWPRLEVNAVHCTDHNISSSTFEVKPGSYVALLLCQIQFNSI